MDTETKLALIGVVFAAVLIFYRVYIAPLIAQNALKSEYQSAAEPLLFLQSGETDPEFWARVQRAIARFEDSKNVWAVKQVPVIAIPFNNVFVIDWFGKQYRYSTVGIGSCEYVRQSNIIFSRMVEIWKGEVFGEFGSSAAFQAQGQDPFDPQKIWN